uniref:Replication factor C C-terminal domain-containing protein n=1 Tax=Micrurus spixii TaxID=129469 RepID=A0A2D4MV07_9SAUR
MSLWVDKYRPTSLCKVDYHREQAAQLRNLVQCGDFPHLLVYGPSGAGKKTRIMCLLRELYGSGVEKLRIEHQTITGLLSELLNNCDGQLKGEVAQMAAFYEHRLQLGNKAIYHLEAFVAKFMALYKKFMEDGLDAMVF